MDNRGGAAGATFFSLSAILVLSLLLLSTADYSLYSYKKKCIAGAIDFSVSAAVQENNIELSRYGYSIGMDESAGTLSTDNIFIDENSAENAFFSTLELNAGIKKSEVISNTMIIIVNPVTGSANYIIKNAAKRITGSVSEPAGLEAVINTNTAQFWDAGQPDKEIVYVNGNPKTNEFKKRPYYMVFIKNYEIDGLFKKRLATFIAFKGANIERKNGNGLEE